MLTKRSNCLVWALRQYVWLIREWRTKGEPHGHEPRFWIRPSRLAPWWVPHSGVERWTGDRWEALSFVPDDKTPLKWWQVFRAVWFRGFVRVGDNA